MSGNDSSSGPSWTTMGNATCLDPDSPEALWPYCPSEAAAILFTVLFGAATCAHLGLAIKYRMAFCWVLIMGASWEFLAFAVRTAATQYQQSMALYVPSLILILLAPLWINAFVYMLFARLVYYFHPAQKAGGIRATRLGVVFVLLDIVSFLVQLTGAAMLTSTDPDQIQLGKNIYMSGIGFQEAFLLVFTTFVVRFHRRMRRTGGQPRTTSYSPTVYFIYASLALITTRIVFRCIEYSQGFTSAIPRTESFQYIFDAVPMLAAALLWAAWHPGRVLVDADGHFPTRAEKKAHRREEKARKSLARAEKKADRQARKEGRRLMGSRMSSPSPVPSVPSPLPPSSYAPVPSAAAYYHAVDAENAMLAPAHYDPVQYGVVE